MTVLLDKLPPTLLFWVIIALILAIVVIALRGKLLAKWGKNIVGIGDAKDGDTKALNKKKDVAAPSVRKRSCGDCVLIMMGEREKYEIKMHKTQNRILKDQMNFAEQKLIEFQSLFIDSYSELISTRRAERASNGAAEEDIQHKVFYGLLRDSLFQVKDEVRRSFKENGFFSLGGSEFAMYVKDKVKTLLSILTQNMRNLYPSYGMFVETVDIVKDIETKMPKVEDIVFEMFIHAKETKVDADTMTKNLRTEFAAWIDTFVK